MLLKTFRCQCLLTYVGIGQFPCGNIPLEHVVVDHTTYLIGHNPSKYEALKQKWLS